MLIKVFAAIFLASRLYGNDDPEAQGKFEKLQEITREYEEKLNADPANTRLALALGDAYYSLREYPNAIKMYKIVLALRPNDNAVKISLANAYLSDKQNQKSAILYEEVLKEESSNVHALAGLGRLAALEYNFQKAEEYYLRGLKIAPSNVNLQYYLADLQIDLKNYSVAEKSLEKLAKEYPSHTWIQKALQRVKDGPLLDKIFQLEEKGSYQEAIGRYKEAIKKNPESLEFYLSLARAYTFSQQPTQAIAVLNKAMNLDPVAKGVNMAFGEAYLANGNFLEAENYVNQVLKKNPDDPEALAFLGKLYLFLGDKDTSEKYYKLSIKANPRSKIALSSYALYLIAQHQELEALKIYEKIAAEDPKAAWAKQSINDIKFDINLHKLAQRYSEKTEEELLNTIDENPLYLPYYIKLGSYYLKHKEEKKAANLYLKGLVHNPKSIDLTAALGNAYLAADMLEASKIQFEEILNLESDNPEALAGLGKLAEKDKQPKKAETLYKKALESNPKNATALNYLAGLLISEKRFDEAELVLEKIKKNYGSPLWVKNAIIDAKNGFLLAEIQTTLDKKNFSKAENLYEQLLIAEPNHIDYYIRAGLFYYHERKYEKAISIYLKGLKIDPENADIYANLGYAYLRTNKIKEAEHSFKKALKLNPKMSEGLSGMGNLWIIRKNYKKAEKFIQEALALTSDNDAALSSLGNLRMAQKKYPEAVLIYQRLMKENPKEKWIIQLYQDALNGLQIDEADRFAKEEKYKEAALIYQSLLHKYPDNPQYASKLGQMYIRLRDYKQASAIFLEGLSQSPNDNDLLVSLSYSYLLGKNLSEAYSTLSKALEQDPLNAEALAGMGHIAAENKCRSSAEEYFLKSLEINPENISALSFYGAFLLKEKRFHEAEQIAIRLQFLLPQAIWVQRMIKDAQDGPIKEIADEFADAEAFENALFIYEQLVDSSPLDPARYVPLGDMYVNLNEYCYGIFAYENGLAVDPEAFYLKRLIAIVYIYLEEYDIAQCLLEEILQEYPEDAETWAVYGKLESLSGSWEWAEEHFLYALSIAPDNQTVVSFYAEFLNTMGFYCSSLAYYNQLLEANSRPKWVRRAYQDLLNKTMPTISLLAGTHEEKQWDSSYHRNSAKYTVNGFGALVNYPIGDGCSIFGKMYDEYFQLRDLLTSRIIYSFDVEKASVGGKTLLCNPHWVFDWQLGFSNYSRYRKGTSDASQGSIFEPGIRFTYREPQKETSFAFWSESNLIARNFQRNSSKLIGRYFFNTTHQQQVYPRTTVGTDFSFSAYTDYVSNTSATAFGWVQWRPPAYSQNISLRYQLKYGKFAENIPDYYTYEDQWVNYVQLTLENNWRVCWADYLYTSISFGYGLQNTLTRFSQFIELDPNINGPLRWDNRQIGILNLKGVYKLDQLQISLILDYYRDSKKYQMNTLLFDLTWRF